MALLERACELIGGDVDTRVGAYVHGSLGRFYGLAGRAAETVALDKLAMAGAERVGDRRLYAWALNNAASHAGTRATPTGSPTSRGHSRSPSRSAVSTSGAAVSTSAPRSATEVSSPRHKTSLRRPGVRFQRVGWGRFERITTSELTGTG